MTLKEISTFCMDLMIGRLRSSLAKGLEWRSFLNTSTNSWERSGSILFWNIIVRRCPIMPAYWYCTELIILRWQLSHAPCMHDRVQIVSMQLVHAVAYAPLYAAYMCTKAVRFHALHYTYPFKFELIHAAYVCLHDHDIVHVEE